MYNNLIMNIVKVNKIEHYCLLIKQLRFNFIFKILI